MPFSFPLVAGGILNVSFSGSPSIETPHCDSKRLRSGWEVDLAPDGFIKVYSFWTKTSTRIIDHQLKGCRIGDFRKPKLQKEPSDILLRRVGEVRHGVDDYKLDRCLGCLYDVEIDIPKTDDVGLPYVVTHIL